MARLNNPADVFSNLTGFGFFRDVTSSPGDTTLDAEAAAGQTVLSVASETNFVANDFLRVGDLGDQEIGKVEAVSSGEITLVSATTYLHENGEVVKEVEKVLIGDIDDAGVGLEWQGNRTQVDVATRNRRYFFTLSGVNARLTANLENHSVENLMLSLGLDETAITGAGSSVDPFKGHLDPELMDALLNHSFFFTGALKDGTTVEAHVSQISIDVNKTINYARQNPAVIPIAIDAGLVTWFQPGL